MEQPLPIAVARLMRARTKDSNGTEVGDWTTATRPTLAAVTALIPEAASQVEARVGLLPDEPATLAALAQHVVALRTALLIELSYWPEQIGTDRSPYDELKTLHDEALTALIGAVKEIEEGGEAGPGDEVLMPSAAFPENQGGLVGWGTIW